MTTAVPSHIVIDDQGRAMVARTRTKVTMIVMDTMNGLTPEQIHQAYPYLSLAQIHAALSYYYDHQTQLDEEIRCGLQEADRLRGEAQASGQQPTRAELERRLREREGRSS